MVAGGTKVNRRSGKIATQSLLRRTLRLSVRRHHVILPGMVELASGTAGSYLAQRRLAPMLGGAMGNLLLRPWFDALALPGIVRWYFPLSRAWAAAGIAGTEIDRFLAEVPTAPLPRRFPRQRERWRLAIPNAMWCAASVHRPA